jgi:hypothetical protein
MQTLKNDNMKTWKFKINSNIQEITKKLDSAFDAKKGFDFKMDDSKDESVTFKVRKRILYAYQVVLRNHIVVNGKIQRTETDNETNVEVSFNQHVFTVFYAYMFSILGLFIIIFGLFSSSNLYLLGGIFLAIGVAFWIGLQKKFKMDTQRYKTLISDILKS